MIRRMLVLAAALLVSAPSLLTAQNFAIAGRAGSLGIGAEAALGLGNRLTLRAGGSLLPVDLDASSLIEVGEDVEVTLTLPESWYNVGADFHLGAGFRIGGGMMFKSDDPTLAGTLTASGTIEIDGQEYSGSEVSSVTGVLDSKDQAPYAIIGFGSPRGAGLGLFLDLGAAFLGDPEVSLSATGSQAVVGSQQFQTQLRNEEQRIEDEAGDYLRMWPIINLGIRIGF